MDQQGSQIAIALLADTAQPPGMAGTVFPGRDAEPAGKGATTFEGMYIRNKALHQPLDSARLALPHQAVCVKCW